MVDLSIIYSKTGKGLRARNASNAGLSTTQLKVLALIDGKSKTNEILNKFNEFTEKELTATLNQLVTNGFIRPLAATEPGTDDWALTSNFTPMVVEEFKSEDEIEAEARALAAQEKQDAERIAAEKANEKIRWKAEISARKELEAKQKTEQIAKAAAIEKALVQQERIAYEAAITQKKQAEEQKVRDDENRAKAKQKAELKELAEIERKTQADAERKTQELADRLALAEAKEQARNEFERGEIERIKRGAAEAQKKAAEVQKNAEIEATMKAAEAAKLKLELQAKAENEAQQEAARKAKAEHKAREAAELARLETERLHKEKLAQLEAERIAKAENDAQLEAARRAKAALKVQEAAEQVRIKKAEKEKADAQAKEVARLEMVRIVGKAEEERKQAEAAAREARQEAKRQVKAEEQARIKATRKAKEEAEQVRVETTVAELKKIALQEAAQIEMERFTREVETTKIIAENVVEESKINAEATRLADTAEASLQAQLQTTVIIEPVNEQVYGQQIEQPVEQAVELPAPVASQADTQQGSVEQEHLLNTPQLNIQQFAAQQALEKAEQIRAINEAEEKADLAAKELAKQEMARIAREADALRSQAGNPSLIKAVKSGRFEASRTAKLKKSTIQAEKSAEKSAEKRAKQVAEIRVRETQNQTYSNQNADQNKVQSHVADPKNSNEKPSAKRIPFDINLVLINSAKWVVKLVKTTLIIGGLLALLLIVMLHFINISPLIEPIEKLSTNSFGSPVRIGQVRASLWPQPHFVLREVAIGDVLKATSMQVIPDITAMFDNVKRVKSLQIQGLVIEPSNADATLQLIQQLGKTPSIKVEQLKLNDLSFKLKDLLLGPFDGNLVLNADGELNSIDLTNNDSTLTAMIKPQGEDYAIALTGANWPLPFNPKIVFNELKAKASMHQNQITFSQIDGGMFGGNISARAVLDWSSDWRATGNFKLTNANAPQLLQAFTSKASVEGKVSANGDFASQSIEALKLADSPTITTNIALKNGKINGVDLTHAVMFNQNASLAGEATVFDTLSANLQVKNGLYSYKQIALDTKQFHAKGNVEIAQNQTISGNVAAALTAQSRRLQSSFVLAGTLGNVKRQ